MKPRLLCATLMIAALFISGCTPDLQRGLLLTPTIDQR